MTEPDVYIKRIQEKVQRLVRQHHDLQKENGQLKKEVEKISKQSAQQLQNIELLRQQVDVLKLSSGDWDASDKKEFEQRLNQYVKEIDKCITLLSQ